MSDRQHVALIVGKSAGPRAARRSDCAAAIEKQCFGNTKACQRMSEEQAHELTDEAIVSFSRSMTTASNDKKKEGKGSAVPKVEEECTTGITDVGARAPVARGTPESHKGKGSPPPRRPTATVAGSPFHCASRQTGKCLRQLLDQMPIYVKNSN